MATQDSSEKESLTHANLGDVSGAEIEIRQSRVGSVNSERASVTQSSVKQLETRSVQLDQSSVYKMNAEDAVINQGAATFVKANDIRLVKSNAFLVRGKTNAVEGDLKTVIFAGEATGNVHMIFDRESAMRFGAVLGAVIVGLSILVRKIFR